MIDNRKPMPSIVLTIMVVISVSWISCWRHHMAGVIPAQIISRVNNLSIIHFDCLLIEVDNAFVLVFKVTQLKGLYVFVNYTRKVHHSIGFHQCGFNIDRHNTDLSSDLLELIHDFHHFLNSFLSQFKIAFCFNTERFVSLTAEISQPMRRKQNPLDLMFFGEVYPKLYELPL